MAPPPPLAPGVSNRVLFPCLSTPKSERTGRGYALASRRSYDRLQPSTRERRLESRDAMKRGGENGPLIDARAAGSGRIYAGVFCSPRPMDRPISAQPSFCVQGRHDRADAQWSDGRRYRTKRRRERDRSSSCRDDDDGGGKQLDNRNATNRHLHRNLSTSIVSLCVMFSCPLHLYFFI